MARKKTKVGECIKHSLAEGKSRAQAIAIALSEQRKKSKEKRG